MVSRKWYKRWWVITVLAIPIIVIVALIISFLYFKNSPQYSLLQISRAYRNRDLTLAKEYIDIESLSEGLSEEVIKIMNQELNKPSTATNEWERLGEEWARSLISGILPSIKQEVKDEFKNSFIESVEGKSESEYLPVFATVRWNDLILPDSNIKVEKAGAIRLVTIPNRRGETLVFRMRKENEKWVIVKWENLGSLAKELAKEDLEKQASESKPREVRFGERADMTRGWFLIVSKPEVYIPQNEFEKAKTGNELVSIEVTYENTGSVDGTFDPSNFELKDNEDHRYKREYSGRDPILESSFLPPGQTVKGFITYEVLEESEIIEVVYSSLSGGNIIFKE